MTNKEHSNNEQWQAKLTAEQFSIWHPQTHGCITALILHH
jgi:hypothetical protein